MNKDFSLKKWNTMATIFNNLLIPKWEDDKFLGILADLPIWSDKIKILDLGCGAGRYSIAMSGRASEIIGSDISPKMIEFAKAKIENTGIENIKFVEEDWNELDIETCGYKDRFDLIIGHMTPAIKSIEDLQKMNEACTGYCVMNTFYRRYSPVIDRAYEYIGLEKIEMENKLPELFNYLYKEGYQPKIEYYERNDAKQFATKEDAKAGIDGRLWYKETMDKDEYQAKLNAFVDLIWDKEQLRDDGTKAIIVTMSWKTRQ